MADKTEPYVIRRGSFSWALEEMKRGLIVTRPDSEYAMSMTEMVDIAPEVYSFIATDKEARVVAGSFRPDASDMAAEDWELFSFIETERTK